MNRLKSLLLVAVAVTIGLFTLAACGGSSAEVEIDELTTSAGVYRVEVVVSGDIEGFKPLLIAYPSYPASAVQAGGTFGTVFDVSGKELSATGTSSYGYNYDEDPENFQSSFVRYTTNKATGFWVGVFPQGSTVLEGGEYEPDEVHKITIAFKGYKDGKLIKQEAVELDNILRPSGFQDGRRSYYDFVIGTRPPVEASN